MGFAFNLAGRGRIYNTFDAHRLLHWAAASDDAQAQHRLKRPLLNAYLAEGLSPSDAEVLLQAVREAGLEVARAADILRGDDYAGAVREREQFYRSQGIHSVPSVIINERYLVQGGQPVETFENALRQTASEA